MMPTEATATIELEDGAYFDVKGVTELTPAGKRFDDYIKYVRWTQFG